MLDDVSLAFAKWVAMSERCHAALFDMLLELKWNYLILRVMISIVNLILILIFGLVSGFMFSVDFRLNRYSLTDGGGCQCMYVFKGYKFMKSPLSSRRKQQKEKKRKYLQVFQIF